MRHFVNAHGYRQDKHVILTGIDCDAVAVAQAKHLDLPIMAVGLKDGDEILHEKQNGHLRTIYLKENRVVGFQLVGDTHAAGILRTLMLQGSDVGPIKHQLLDPNFRYGSIVYQALEPMSLAR